MQVVRHVAHGSLKAGDVGELAGVSGNTIGQWARWGYIRASVSDGDPHVYAVEDVLEAATVQALRERGVTHAQIRRAIAGLGGYGEWPLSEAPLATTPAPRPRIVLREREGVYALSRCGWQLMVAAPPLEDVRVRLKRSLRKRG
jgi:DNA-binding transcriptional MerR regulator